MKSIAACWRPYLEGKVMYNELANIKVHLIGEEQYDFDTGKIENVFYYFVDYSRWEIYTPPDWKEELNGKETLGYVRDNETNAWEPFPVIADGHEKGDSFPFKTEIENWVYFKRATKAQIQVWMDNAPEVEDD